MFAPIKTLTFTFVCCALLFIITDQQRCFANSYDYAEEHAAWGGNGGWWGGGNADLYHDYSWRTDDTCAPHCQNYRRYHSCNHCRVWRSPQGYCHRCDTLPVDEYEYHDSVPGAGLYIHSR